MFTDANLIITIINVACILFFLLMLIILAAGTRMKGGAGWAALIMVTAMLPASLSNLTRDMALEHFVWFIYPRVFISLLWFPAVWLFTKSQLDKSFRFTSRELLHLIPAFISLISAIIYYAPLTGGQLEAERIAWTAGNENLPVFINDIFGFGQFLGYFTAIFFYVRKQKKYLLSQYSDSALANINWIIKFLIVHFVLFLIAMLIYSIFPITDSWICPLSVVLIMAYLLYVVIYHSTTPNISLLPASPSRTNSLPAMHPEQMKEICDTVIQYLSTTKKYKDCDFTLAALSYETGIHNGTISTAINTHLKKNFFEIVNAMRIEEAKRLLQNLSANHTIESVVAECGFHSRSTFFATFKKMEGTSPAQWLKKVSPK